MRSPSERLAALVAEVEALEQDAHADAHRDLRGAALYLRRALERHDGALARAERKATEAARAAEKARRA